MKPQYLLLSLAMLVCTAEVDAYEQATHARLTIASFSASSFYGSAPNSLITSLGLNT
jgi:hypothetical protein